MVSVAAEAAAVVPMHSYGQDLGMVSMVASAARDLHLSAPSQILSQSATVDVSIWVAP